MPNRYVHGSVGTASGGLYAVYMSHGQPLSYVMAEAAGGAVGGYAGGVLPDRIDVATHPGHRADAHSMALTGTVGWMVREPARVAGCSAKSGGQICSGAHADGELSFADIVLDRRVFLSIRGGFICWGLGGLCFAPGAGFFHPGVFTCHLETG